MQIINICRRYPLITLYKNWRDLTRDVMLLNGDHGLRLKNRVKTLTSHNFQSYQPFRGAKRHSKLPNETFFFLFFVGCRKKAELAETLI